MTDRPGAAGVALADVSLTYGRGDRRVAALSSVDLEVPRGCVVAVCGRNGAGKTTLLDVATGFRAPDRGQVRVLGHDPRALDPQGRARLGVALAESGLPPAATGRRLLAHVARLHRAPADVDDLVERLSLQQALGRPVRRMSSGQRQRLAVACALVGRPDVLVLDEPTSMLDAEGRRAVVGLIRQACDGGASVLWTSHTLVDVARASDRVIVLSHGRVLADAPPDALSGTDDVVRFEAAVGSDVATLQQALPARLVAREAGAGGFEVVGSRVDASVLATVSTWQAAHGGTGRLTVGPRDLEDVLLALSDATTGPGQGDGADAEREPSDRMASTGELR